MADHICPWWMGYFLINPLRRFYHSPAKIVAPYVREGMHVLDVGPGMGFFSIPLAHYVGDSGRVYCLDVQERMLRALRRRAKRANVADRLELRLVSGKKLQIEDLPNKIDFILAFAVVHEVEAQDDFFRELYGALKTDGLLLISEPKNHVTAESYKVTLDLAEKNGFRVADRPVISKSYSVLMRK